MSTQNQCPECGKVIKPKSKLCSSCNGKKWSANFSRAFNQEHRDKISKALKGRKKSSQHIENMRKGSIERERKYQEMFDNGETPPDNKNRHALGYTRVRKNGYVMVKIQVGKNTHNFVSLHRHIMEDHLGRKLERKEHIHHVDGDKSNNDLSNLLLLTNVQHNKLNYFMALLKELNNESQVKISQTLKVRFPDLF